MSSSVLFGLILAGGASTRMQRDKALLQYHGKPQLHWAYELAARSCAATFIAVRPDQRDEPTRAGLPQIIDRQAGIGPIAGIVAAQMEHPKAAWLVLACDLPYLDQGTLEYLVEQRDPRSMASAYRSHHDGLPEPLCAVWEPASREPLQAYVASGKYCPRKFLLQAQTTLLDLPSAKALDNINTRAEFAAANAALASRESADAQGATTAALRLRIQYYALFREQAGRSEEFLETTAATPNDLYKELQSRYPFKLAPEQLKVAVNADFSDWNATLRQGDTVVFIPPVAGG